MKLNHAQATIVVIAGMAVGIGVGHWLNSKGAFIREPAVLVVNGVPECTAVTAAAQFEMGFQGKSPLCKPVRKAKRLPMQSLGFKSK